ncbi:hypothetical protein QQF64_018928 [Cirrhinus molitorella]|uniref:DUF4371 domain-containing protein n=1 Tax=Cirrhinus molitorella TaxID=172907 RepID=A0ABR3LE10_9TELE
MLLLVEDVKPIPLGSLLLVFKMFKKIESGAQKRRNKIEREKREANLTAKIPKLTNYFGSLLDKTSVPVENPECSGNTRLASPTVADPCALHVEDDKNDSNIPGHSEILAPALPPALTSDNISGQTAGKNYIYSTDPGCWPAPKDLYIVLFANCLEAFHHFLDRLDSVTGNTHTVAFLIMRTPNNTESAWGDTETFSSPNNGNYMGILELIAQFDPFLREHIARFGNAGRGNPSYLSSTICEEIVKLMGEKVLSDIVNKIKLAKYFSISVDSTPDISHIDQLTFIVRYLSPEGNIEERFLEFLPITSHTGESLFNSVMSVLIELGIDINNCRGQCYDSASNMSGVYKGVQSRIREVITSGLEANENKRIEKIKSLSDTRWSAHASATKSCSELNVVWREEDFKQKYNMKIIQLQLCTPPKLSNSTRLHLNESTECHNHTVLEFIDQNQTQWQIISIISGLMNGLLIILLFGLLKGFIFGSRRSLKCSRQPNADLQKMQVIKQQDPDQLQRAASTASRKCREPRSSLGTPGVPLLSQKSNF